MTESKHYRQIRIPLSIVDRERVAVAKEWTERNNKPIQYWPGFHFVKRYFK